MNTTKDTTDVATLRQSGEQDVGLKAETSHHEWGPPPSVAKMTPEERLAAETRLKRKIDLRLLPPLVIMYILSSSL